MNVFVSFLIGVLIQSTLIIALGLFAANMLRRQGAAMQSFVLGSSLVLMQPKMLQPKMPVFRSLLVYDSIVTKLPTGCLSFYPVVNGRLATRYDTRLGG